MLQQNIINTSKRDVQQFFTYLLFIVSLLLHSTKVTSLQVVASGCGQVGNLPRPAVTDNQPPLSFSGYRQYTSVTLPLIPGLCLPSPPVYCIRMKILQLQIRDYDNNFMSRGIRKQENGLQIGLQPQNNDINDWENTCHSFIYSLVPGKDQTIAQLGINEHEDLKCRL